MNHTPRIHIPLLSFVVGVLLVLLAFHIPSTRAIIDLFRLNGYPAAFLAGILYSPSLTSPFSTALFYASKSELNAVVVAVLGGCGAVLYDIAVFALIRREIRPKVSEQLRAWWTRNKRFTPLYWLAGLVILASPLPDELVSVFLGMVSIPARAFILLSFVLNTLGIFTIVALGR